MKKSNENQEILTKLHGEWFREKEVAELLKISTKTLERDRKEGNITFHTFRDTIRYNNKHVADYIDKNEKRENPVKELII